MQHAAQAAGLRGPKIVPGLDTGIAEMKRDRSRTHEDDSALDDSDFFRRVEEAEMATGDGDWEEPSVAEEVESLLDEPEDEIDWEVDEVEELYESELPPSRANEGAIAVPIGWALGLLGIGLGIASTAAPEAVGRLTQVLSGIGLTPFAFCLAGLIFGATGIGRSQAARRNSIQERRLNALDRTVRAIAESGPRNSGQLDDPEGNRDIDRMFVALQRQDEKINNLTRATKLYGKPLIEISNQVTELTNHVQDTEPMMDEIRKALSGSIESLTTKMDELGEQVVRAMSGLKSSIEETQLEISDNTQRAREERQKSLDEVVTRIQDEQHKSLEDVVGRIHEERSKSLDEIVGRIQEDARKSLDDAMQQVHEAISGLQGSTSGNDGLDDLERGISSIQREVQGLATAISRIESRPAAAAAPRASAPAPAAAAAPAASGAPSGGDSGEIAQKIAGARQASGKNVLGAIAKLKSMRT